MPRGTITRLVHYTGDTQLPNTELVPSHNYAGFGFLSGENDERIYFSYDAAPPAKFDHLEEGQVVEYEIDRTSTDPPRAKSIRIPADEGGE